MRDNDKEREALIKQEEKERKARIKQEKKRAEKGCGPVITKVRHPRRGLREVFSRRDSSPNKKKEFKNFLKQAKSGDAEAQYQVGYSYFKGIHVKKDYKKAVEWLSKASKQNYIPALTLLAECYGSGRGVEKNLSESTRLYAIAGSLKTMQRQKKYGVPQNSTTVGTEKPAEPDKEFMAIASTVDTDAVNFSEPEDAVGQCNLAWAYCNGYNVEKDYAKAAYWWTKSAEQGNVVAQYNMGVCYDNGYGVTKDSTKAMYWYTKSAEQGDDSAQFNLGACYKNGEGVPQDHTKAAYWYTKAAEQGNVRAQYNLGVCYDNGEGVSQDHAKAAYWYQKAADQGEAVAQYNLGVCYDNGEGVPQDNVKAAYWYKKAADQGDADAKKALDKFN